MRTIIDINSEQLKPLDAQCRLEGISRAEFIRQGIDLRMQASRKESEKVTLEAVQALFKGDNPWGDGLEYQRNIRAEWDDRQRVIDEWAEAISAKKLPAKDAGKLGSSFKKSKKLK